MNAYEDFTASKGNMLEYFDWREVQRMFERQHKLKLIYDYVNDDQVSIREIRFKSEDAAIMFILKWS